MGQADSPAGDGFFPQLGMVPSLPLVSEKEALSQALAEIGASQYLWEVPFFEKLIQDIKQDPTASYYPEAEILLTDTDFDWDTEEYVLAYKFEIMTAVPHGSYWVYVNALDGSD